MSVRNLYAAACSYIINKFPLNCELLSCAEVADISLRKTRSFSNIEYFVENYPCLLGDVSKCDALQLEYLKYQMNTLPSEIDSGKIRIDIAWNKIGQIKGTDVNPKYPLLTNVMKGILVIPHSNAESKRAFSSMRKTKTEFRPNLSDQQLSALVVEKFRMFSSRVVCYVQTFSEELQRKAESATYQQLQQQNTK